MNDVVGLLYLQKMKYQVIIGLMKVSPPLLCYVVEEAENFIPKKCLSVKAILWGAQENMVQYVVF